MTQSVRVLLGDGNRKLLEGFLEGHPHDPVAILIRSNLEQTGLVPYSGAPFEGEYVGMVNDAGLLEAIIVHYWTGAAMLVAGSLDDGVFELVKSTHSLFSRPINRIEGPEHLVQRLEPSIPHLTHLTRKTSMILDLKGYQIESKPKSDFHMDLPNQADAAVLERLRLEFLLESHGKFNKDVQMSEEKMEELGQSAKRYVKEMGQALGLVRVLRSPTGDLLCMLTYNALIRKKAVVYGNVFCPAEQRRRGYARALLGESLKELEAEGVRTAALYTNNPVAIALYRSLGFQETSQKLAVLH